MKDEEIRQLIAYQAALIDQDRLEEWLDLFTPNAAYRIVPRENWDAGLPLALIDCAGSLMIRDRINALRKANEFNFHVSAHILSLPCIARSDDGVAKVETPFVVYQSYPEGDTRLFAVGRYVDQVAAGQFHSKTVILDSFNVPTLLARPI